MNRHLLALFLLILASPCPAQDQFPSPMVEYTREHPRRKMETPTGKREKLELGTLFLPERLPRTDTTPLLLHFHGAPWLAEVAASEHGKLAVITFQLGSGSGTYGKPFTDPALFARLLAEAEKKAGTRFEPITLSGWSAGYGAIREILKVPEHRARVRTVLLLDGLHASYVNGKPGPKDSQLVTNNLEEFVAFAQEAVAGRKQMIIIHTEIFPGTFASTTETADHLLRQLGLRRTPVLKWGPQRTQQLSEVKQGRFQLLGFAGNSAPDHVDHLHALPEYVKWIE